MNQSKIRDELATLCQKWAEDGAYNPDDMAQNIIDFVDKGRRTKDLMDHELATLVNELTATADDYCHAQCLRGQIRTVLFKYLHFLPNAKKYR